MRPLKSLLVIGDTNSPYVHDYAMQLRKHFGSSLCLDIFATFPPRRKAGTMPYDHIFGQPVHDTSRFAAKIRYISRPWRLFRFLTGRKGAYDAVHVLYCIQDLLFVGKPLRMAASRLILTVFGSDFFQLSGFKKPWYRKVFQSADFVTSNNSMAMEKIRDDFSLRPERLKICRFGNDTLETIGRLENIPIRVSRELLHLPTGKKIICIGYNYDSIQQHIPVLQSIAENIELRRQKDELFFLVPMTYGTEAGYRARLLDALSRFPFHYLTLEKFLSQEENAHLRRVPDIIIQLQKSDSLSASTQEHMFAGNLLITGDWLPYDDMVNAGIYFRTVADPRQSGPELLNCLENLEAEKQKCTGNRGAIKKLSSWSANIDSWLGLYN
jgi:hypothetical protein